MFATGKSTQTPSRGGSGGGWGRGGRYDCRHDRRDAASGVGGAAAQPGGTLKPQRKMHLKTENSTAWELYLNLKKNVH